MNFRRIADRILFVFAYASVCGLLHATEINVASSGNDAAGNGSAAQPYREIRKALERAKPGDTILVADGQYAGFTLQNFKAVNDRQLTIKAQGQGAEVLRTSDRRDNRDTIYIDGCSYIVVDGFRSFNANRAALRLEGSDHVTIRNCVFGNNGIWGIFTGHCDDLLIENNECYGSVNEHGIYTSNSGDRPVIRGNRSHDNSGCGIHMNADLSCGGDGIISGAIVENNVVYDNGRKGGAGINMDGVQDSLIQNNLLFNNHASGIACFKINGAAGPKGLKILNNTIVMSGDARYALQFGQTAGVNIVRNNILYNLNPVRGGLAYFNASADLPNVDSAYNIFPKEAPTVAVDDWKTRYPLPQWQTMGHEKNSFVCSQSELFTDAAAKDYRLRQDSPAIGRGEKSEAGASSDIGCVKYPGK